MARKLNTFEVDGDTFATLQSVQADTMDFIMGFRFVDTHMVEICQLVTYMFDDKQERDVKRYSFGRQFLEDLFLFHKMEKELGIGYMLLT